VFENRVLREIFGPKRDEVGDRIKSHNEKLNDLYCSPNVVRVRESSGLLGLRNRVGWGARGRRHLIGENRTAYRVLVGNLMGKRQLGKSRRGRQYNIK
jgi:hypothetical protein